MECSDKEIDQLVLKKMIFIYNALDTGWSVSKSPEKNTYIFKKPHLNDKTIMLDDYLPSFIQSNFTINPFQNFKMD
jgi:hypothetical protein